MYSSRTVKLTSSPRCLAKIEANMLNGSGMFSSRCLKSSSSFSNDFPLVVVIKVAASNRTGSTNGFSAIFYLMNSSTLMSRFPPTCKRKRGAIPPKIGNNEASTSTFPTILMMRSESFFQMFNLISREIPLRSCIRRGSPPSSRSFLGEAASLRATSMFWSTFNSLWIVVKSSPNY